MKVRTDFVTNSSSSSFIITFTFKLKSDKRISLEVAEDMEGWIESAYTSLQGDISPKQLAKCRSIEGIIKRLRKEVTGAKYSKEADDYVSLSILDDTENEEVVEFLEQLRSLKAVSQIEEITVSGSSESHNGYSFGQTYTYNRDTKEYTAKIFGEEIIEETYGDRITPPDFTEAAIVVNADSLDRLRFAKDLPLDFTLTAHGEAAKRVRVGDVLQLRPNTTGAKVIDAEGAEIGWLHKAPNVSFNTTAHEFNIGYYSQLLEAEVVSVAEQQFRWHDSRIFDAPRIEVQVRRKEK